MGIAIIVIIMHYAPPGIYRNNLQSMSNIWQYVGFITLAVLCEVMNAYMMNRVFFKKKKVSAWYKVVNCFSDARFCYLTAVISTLLFINPVFAFSVLDF